MMPPLEKILEEFERLTHETQAFFQFSTDDGLDVCLMYVKTDQKKWSIWFKTAESESKQNLTREHLSRVIATFKIGGDEVSLQLSNQLLMEAAYADQFVREVGELFGPEALQKAILGTQNFIEDFKKIVSQLLGEKSEKPLEKIVRPALRVIKSPKD